MRYWIAGKAHCRFSSAVNDADSGSPLDAFGGPEIEAAITLVQHIFNAGWGRIRSSGVHVTGHDDGVGVIAHFVQEFRHLLATDFRLGTVFQMCARNRDAVTRRVGNVQVDEQRCSELAAAHFP